LFAVVWDQGLTIGFVNIRTNLGDHSVRPDSRRTCEHRCFLDAHSYFIR
jgi:hypothetical protein